MFKFAANVGGNKKETPEATAVKDPISGKMMTSKKNIKKTFLDYCSKVLEKNIPEEGFEKEFELKNELHDLRMLKDTNDTEIINDEFTQDNFKDAFKKFKKKNKKAYNYIVKAGDTFKDGIFKFLERIHSEEITPDS